MYVRNILFAIGIAALLAGAVLAALWLGQSGSGGGEAGTEAPQVSILVAASDIASGTLLRANDLAWQNVPADKVPPAAIRNVPGTEKALVGAVTRRSFAAGEALVPGGVVKPGERGFLAAVLAPGMRALSLSVDAASSVAGLVQPGDRVDVLLAESFADTGASRGASAVSETVLRDVRVVAIDQWFAADEKPLTADGRFGTAESHVPKTVTLEVDEEDAKRLLVAAQLGKVTLVMRALQRPYGSATVESGPVWAAEVSGGSRGRTPSSQRLSGSPAAMSGRSSVRIMRGSKVEAQ